MRSALDTAITRFNGSNESKKLLAPLRNDAKKNTNADAAAAERAIAHRLAFYLEDELRRLDLVKDNGVLSVNVEYCNILRDDGLSYGDYVEQLTFLLFLKMAEVERRLRVVEELETVVSANLQWAVRLRQSVLPKAFTGQL